MEDLLCQIRLIGRRTARVDGRTTEKSYSKFQDVEGIGDKSKCEE